MISDRTKYHIIMVMHHVLRWIPLGVPGRKMLGKMYGCLIKDLLSRYGQ